jgi:hypothetical protein
VRVDTKQVAGDHPTTSMDAYLNGRPMHRAPKAAPGVVAFRASREMFRAGIMQDLVLTSARFRTIGAADRRRLGVPVFSIDFIPQDTVAKGGVLRTRQP